MRAAPLRLSRHFLPLPFPPLPHNRRFLHRPLNLVPIQQPARNVRHKIIPSPVIAQRDVVNVPAFLARKPSIPLPNLNLAQPRLPHSRQPALRRHLQRPLPRARLRQRPHRQRTKQILAPPPTSPMHPTTPFPSVASSLSRFVAWSFHPSSRTLPIPSSKVLFTLPQPMSRNPPRHHLKILRHPLPQTLPQRPPHIVRRPSRRMIRIQWRWCVHHRYQLAPHVVQTRIIESPQPHEPALPPRPHHLSRNPELLRRLPHRNARPVNHHRLGQLPNRLPIQRHLVRHLPLIRAPRLDLSPSLGDPRIARPQTQAPRPHRPKHALAKLPPHPPHRLPRLPRTPRPHSLPRLNQIQINLIHDSSPLAR